MRHRLLHLTDCHLFAGPDQALRGIVTRPRLLAVLADIRRRAADAELIVLSGDTAHDERTETYRAVRDALGELSSRVRIVPGNHDDRSGLREVFPQTTSGPTDRVTFESDVGDWRVIGLDTQRPGELPGTVGSEQLAWLRSQLETDSRAILLFMHHPPIEVGSPWLDRIGLQDAEDFKLVLGDHPQARLLCCGHVHQELAGSLGSTAILTTPAVGPHFLPRTEELVIDAAAPPAYRVLELDPDGRWTSQVLHCRES